MLGQAAAAGLGAVGGGGMVVAGAGGSRQDVRAVGAIALLAAGVRGLVHRFLLEKG